MATFRRFWLVQNATVPAPVSRHYSREQAEAEALRRSQENPHLQYVVLESIRMTPKAPTQWLEPEDEEDT